MIYQYHFQCHFVIGMFLMFEIKKILHDAKIFHLSSSLWSSQDMCLEHSSRMLYCGYFHLEQA